MVEEIVNKMIKSVNTLQEAIKQDMEDTKKAKHEELLKRNDEKHLIIDEISSLKIELNKELAKKIEEGVDVNIYRQQVDNLEVQLKELYILNKKLASIVLPIQQMYKELTEEINMANGGKTFDVTA